MQNKGVVGNQSTRTLLRHQIAGVLGNKNNKNWDVTILVLGKQKHKNAHNLKNNRNLATKAAYSSSNGESCHKVPTSGSTSTKHYPCLNMFGKSKQVGLAAEKLSVGALYCILGPGSKCFRRRSLHGRQPALVVMQSCRRLWQKNVKKGFGAGTAPPTFNNVNAGVKG